MNTHIANKQIFRYIFHIVKPFVISIYIMLFTSIVTAVDASLRPYLLKIILNRVASNTKQDIFIDIATPILLFLIAVFFRNFMYRIYGYFIDIKTIPNLRAKIASESLDLLLDKSHGYYQNIFSGSLANKVNNLTDSIPELLQTIIDYFLASFLICIIATFTLWQVNAIFAFFMTIFVIILTTGALLFSRRLTLLADNWSELGSVITGKLVDIFSNMLAMRLFATKSQEKKYLNKTLQKAVSAEQRLEWAYFFMWVCYSFAFLTFEGISLYFLCKGKQAGWVTTGDFALVLSINGTIFDCIWNLTKHFSNFSKHFGRISQALRFILEKPEIQDKPGATELKVTQGCIVFDKVKFCYKEKHECLFQNNSVIIEAGQKVGLVGYSGSGKTTFINLILRFHDVDQGRILIDGQDIRDVTQDSLRNKIAVVPQDSSLFHRTLMENIRYGKVTATDAEVIEAAKNAHAHNFIMKLPLKYETLVGERGVKLSGVQRQRIAIARAMLKNAPILILDEATSQLDSITERYIQESLWKLMHGKTSILIAHRISTLLHMDRILVFNKGKIVEDGTHTELLAKRQLYQTLWNAQANGILPDNPDNIESE